MICTTEKMTGTEIKHGLRDCFFTMKAEPLEKSLALDDSFSGERSPLIMTARRVNTVFDIRKFTTSM